MLIRFDAVKFSDCDIREAILEHFCRRYTEFLGRVAEITLNECDGDFTALVTVPVDDKTR